METSIIDWITFGIAVLGAALGVYNAVVEYRRRIPRLRLSLRWVLLYFGGSQGDFAWGLAIKVMNVGEIPVKILQIGVERKGRGFIRVDAIPVEGWGEPERIESGDAVIMRIPRETFRGSPIEEVGRVFVELPSEKKFYTRCVRDYVRILQSGPDNDLKELKVPPLMTVTAPENASDDEKRQIEQGAQNEYEIHC